MSSKQGNISFFGSAFYIFSGRFFNNVAVLAVMYFLTRHFSTTLYGIYGGLSSLLNFFTIIAGISIPVFTLVYPADKLVAFFRSFKAAHYWGYGVMLFFSAALFAALQYQDIPEWYLLLVFFILFTAANITDAFLIAFKQHRWLAFINLVYSFLFILIHLTILDLAMPFGKLLLYWMGILFIKIIFSIFIFRKNFETPALPVQREHKAQMISLWKHLYLADIIQVSFLWVDKFIIFFLASRETMAVYYNGTLQIPFIMTAFSAVSSAALQILSSRNDKSIQIQMVKNVGKILSSIMFPAFLFLMFFGKSFFIFFFSEKYALSVPVFICSVMILPLRAYNFSMLLQKNEKGKIITVGATGDLIIALLLMYPLYQLLGLPGLALSFVLSTLCQSVFYAYFTAKTLQVHMMNLFPWKNWIAKVVLFSVLCCAFYYLPDVVLSMPGFLVAGIIISLIALLIFLWEFKHIRTVPAYTSDTE